MASVNNKTMFVFTFILLGRFPLILTCKFPASAVFGQACSVKIIRISAFASSLIRNSHYFL